MEMEMRSGEDIGRGEDITPPLSPLSFALHDSFLHSHCSSCFSPLPNPPFPPAISLSFPSPSPTLLYCSALCSSSDSPLHFNSAEFHLFHSVSSISPPTSDLRAALRLLHSLPPHSHRHGRISGLLTNREKLIADDEIFARVRDGARTMASARRLRDGKENDIALLEEEEAALCLMLTNAVEVQDSNGRALGIAVYDTSFSWINHSCSANACYRFLLSPPATPSFAAGSRLQIVPAGSNGKKSLYNNFEFTKGYSEYGPRLIVRSIKRIKSNEEVTVAYTDLLQPKAIRQSELWSKYRFICCCTRCSALPPSYVDHILQEVTASNLASSSLSSDQSFCRDEATRRLTDYIDVVIAEYLSVDDAKSCCEKLESVLTLGFIDESSETKEGKSQLNVRLHPLNHLALNAYMTLASAYRIRATNSEMDGRQMEGFDMSRTAAAYSFLLAAATYHLFCLEPSLIASLANFCTSAGESLLTLARSSVWSLFGKWERPGSKKFPLGKHKCSLMDRFEANLSIGQGQNEDFENISCNFLDCISRFSKKVWSSLTQDCHYLEMFNDPIDFISLRAFFSTSDIEANLVRDHVDSDWTEERTPAQNFTNQERMNIFQLGLHCLLYGELLASICYGNHSHSTTLIQSHLSYEEK